MAVPLDLDVCLVRGPEELERLRVLPPPEEELRVRVHAHGPKDQRVLVSRTWIRKKIRRDEG